MAVQTTIADLTLLAWRKYPEPNGTNYSPEDLQNELTVEVLFDYCQIFEAVIYAPGWHYLFKTYGIEGILRINQRSGWYEEDSQAMLVYQSHVAGYDPIADAFGTYNEASGIFTPHAIDILTSAPGQQIFQTPADADRYIQEKRTS
jgi:hypothetical protein